MNMNRFAVLLLLVGTILFWGCQNQPNNEQISMESTDDTVLRVAFLGDGEPKPLAEFPNIAAAVEHINTFADSIRIDFVAGVGDIAHKGTEIQYIEATKVLQHLELPFYPIMGNEEHSESEDRYMEYARQWNPKIDSVSYVLDYEKVTLIFASPDFSRDFNDTGASWILEQVQRVAPKPVMLIVHGAQVGVYPENAEKGVTNELFIQQVITQPNLVAVISGDLHMDMPRVDHSKEINGVHYLHIPGLERTKIPDETQHTPFIRIMSILADGSVEVDTYTVGNFTPHSEFFYSFKIW
jgi:3',5'-cyclic-AMP phosphodiesterase